MAGRRVWAACHEQLLVGRQQCSTRQVEGGGADTFQGDASRRARAHPSLPAPAIAQQRLLLPPHVLLQAWSAPGQAASSRRCLSSVPPAACGRFTRRRASRPAMQSQHRRRQQPAPGRRQKQHPRRGLPPRSAGQTSCSRPLSPPPIFPQPNRMYFQPASAAGAAAAAPRTAPPSVVTQARTFSPHLPACALLDQPPQSVIT